MLLSLVISIPPRKAVDVLFRTFLFLLLCVNAGLSQKAQTEDSRLPNYDLHTETKLKE